jgi:hypothetical protein
MSSKEHQVKKARCRNTPQEGMWGWEFAGIRQADKEHQAGQTDHRHMHTAAALLLPLCCCRSAAAALLLPLCCCRSAAAALLLPLCCCRSAAAALLLPPSCWPSAAAVTLFTAAAAYKPLRIAARSAESFLGSWQACIVFTCSTSSSLRDQCGKQKGIKQTRSRRGRLVRCSQLHDPRMDSSGAPDTCIGWQGLGTVCLTGVTAAVLSIEKLHVWLWVLHAWTASSGGAAQDDPHMSQDRAAQAHVMCAHPYFWPKPKPLPNVLKHIQQGIAGGPAWCSCWATAGLQGIKLQDR